MKTSVIETINYTNTGAIYVTITTPNMDIEAKPTQYSLYENAVQTIKDALGSSYSVEIATSPDIETDSPEIIIRTKEIVGTSATGTSIYKELSAEDIEIISNRLTDSKIITPPQVQWLKDSFIARSAYATVEQIIDDNFHDMMIREDADSLYILTSLKELTVGNYFPNLVSCSLFSISKAFANLPEEFQCYPNIESQLKLFQTQYGTFLQNKFTALQSEVLLDTIEDLSQSDSEINKELADTLHHILEKGFDGKIECSRATCNQLKQLYDFANTDSSFVLDGDNFGETKAIIKDFVQTFEQEILQAAHTHGSRTYIQKILSKNKNTPDVSPVACLPEEITVRIANFTGYKDLILEERKQTEVGQSCYFG